MNYNDITDLQLALEVRSSETSQLFGPHKCSSALLDCLEYIKDDTIRRVCKASMYSKKDALDLWHAAERFCTNFPSMVAQQEEICQLSVDTFNELWPSQLKYRPWGTILVCIPANAIIPLAIILPLALMASGNRIVMAFSQKIRDIGIRLAQHIEPVFSGNIFTWGGSVRNVVDGLIESGPHIDLLYYMGGSAQYPVIVEKCARKGVDLHYEGEGRTLVLLDKEMSAEEIYASAHNILLSKVFCNGMMCSSPNAILVHRKCLSDFTSAYTSLCKEGRYEVTYLSDTITRFRNIYGNEKPTTKSENSPCFWEVDLPTALSSEELFCPGVLIASYDNLDECMGYISKTRHRLQISLFSQDRNFVERILSNTGFARYCFNMNPALQDPCLPWGNYGSSGFSGVANFYQKGLRKVIVEGIGL